MSDHVETKAQRIERLKKEINPWEQIEQLRRFAMDGLSSVPREWLDVYFRWWGIYTQGDGHGVRGKSVPYFMVRIRIPNGLLHARQALTIASLAERFGRGIADITVRQNLQLHWVRIEDIPSIVEELSRAGLTTMGSCGDDTRNITGCPLSGIDREEIEDASVLVQKATRMLLARDLYNLPRKFKVTLTGCRHWCSHPEINDVALTAVEPLAYALRVGGGLSTQPHFAVPVGIYIPEEHVLPVLRAVAEIFRDAEELRGNRARARLKFLFLDHGWTAERFRKEISRRTGIRFEALSEDPVPAPVFRDHIGIHPQKQPGLFYAGFSILRGRISSRDLARAADLSERFGDGHLRTTGMQNLLITNLREEHLRSVEEAVSDTELRLHASAFRRGIVACTGTQFCKIAISETKDFSSWLATELERRAPEFEEPLRIHVNGCPNSCGHLWIADVGLQGCKVKRDGIEVDGFDFLIGGNVGQDARFANRVGFRAAAREVPEAIARLFKEYTRLRQHEEPFRHFCRRHDASELRQMLAGVEIAAEEAPVAIGRPPHGVEV